MWTRTGPSESAASCELQEQTRAAECKHRDEPHRGGAQCNEAPGVQPYWTGAGAKQSATDYSMGRSHQAEPRTRREQISQRVDDQCKQSAHRRCRDALTI
jgi:hypothetical protein